MLYKGMAQRIRSHRCEGGMTNLFWAVYNKRGKVISISIDKETAQFEALRILGNRWTYQTFDRDWELAKKDGVKILRSEINPLKI